MQLDQRLGLWFGTHEAVVLTGFSRYMLDYLAREEIFAASAPDQGRKGLRRKYSYEDIVLLRALHKICHGRGKIRHLKDALGAFRDNFGPLKPGQRIERQLFVQDDELCTYSKVEGGRQLRSGQLIFSVVIDLSIVSQEVTKCFSWDRRTAAWKMVPRIAAEAEAERMRHWERIRARRLDHAAAA